MNKQEPSMPSLPKRLSLVAQTVDSLREGIDCGHWREFLPGERELCESLQVSRRTLRLALDELQRQGWLEVSSRQRRRIKTRSVNPAKNEGKRVIAVLAPGSFLDMPAPVSFVMDTLRRRLTAAGYVVQVHFNPACYGNSPDRVLKKFVADHPAKAWLVLSVQAPMQRWFDDQKLPCMIFGSAAPGIHLPSVDTDFFALCQHAGNLLLRRGHRRIAFVLPKGSYGGDIASEAGLRAALKEKPDAQLKMLRHNATAAGLCALLDEALRSPEPPTAYLVARAGHVITIMMHLMRRGVRIPKDVAVLSRDNDPILESTSPSVGRYGIQTPQLAQRMVLALRQLADTGVVATPQVRLIPTFIEGDSC
jgi:DNA-binding LacI/PurR family transcriptional regulator